MTPHWSDLLEVEPTATTDEIRTAWRAAVADLDPTDRRFRVYNEAAEVLLDPARRAAYDVELERERGRSEAAKPRRSDRSQTAVSLLARPQRWLSGLMTRTGPHPGAEMDASGVLPVVPGWLLTALAGLLAASVVVGGVLVSKPSDASVAEDTRAAQAAAERAIVPLLSYDAHHLDQSAAAAHRYLTPAETQQYDKLFAVIRQNAPHTGTVVRARYLDSGIVRSGTDRVDVLVFVDQVTHNLQHRKVPVVYKNQVTMTMAKVGGQWLVDDLNTNITHS
jgi:Mce-associated membrane protein